MRTSLTEQSRIEEKDDDEREKKKFFCRSIVFVSLLHTQHQDWKCYNLYYDIIIGAHINPTHKSL